MKLGYDLIVWERMHLKIPVILDQKRYCSLMCSGQSGSGKTYFLQYALTHLEPCNLYFMDFKHDFAQYDSCKNYVGGDAIPDALEEYYDFFQKVRRREAIQERQHILVIDEFAALLLYLEKKKADRIRRIIMELLMLGRGTGKNGFGTWICCQNMHAEIFGNTSVKENAMIQVRLGDSSSIAWKMQFEGIEKPLRRFDRSQGCILCDGKNLQQLIVPKINNPERMYEIVADHLNGIWDSS